MSRSEQLKLLSLEDPATRIQFVFGGLEFLGISACLGAAMCGLFRLPSEKGAWLEVARQVHENLFGPERASSTLVNGMGPNVAKVYGIVRRSHFVGLLDADAPRS